jgi:hypothetical protein
LLFRAFGDEIVRRSIVSSAMEKEVVEAAEIPETHPEHVHDGGGHEGFRKFAGVYLGVVAMLLAITSLDGTNATKEMLSANILASDTYAYYQAKYQRQLNYLIAAIAAAPQMSAEARQRAQAAIARYRATAGLESEQPGDNGKNELLAKARQWEQRRDRAEERDRNFALAAALFQIAIVLGSVSIVAASRPLVYLSGALASLATLMMANGYFVLFSPTVRIGDQPPLSRIGVF